ncbi:DUF1045 domain-containing protein [Mesorhizobium japonicum]|uniref:Mll9142 protein n=1 Tax=Mesorhizobium japonicum (strain LMG 29417 / CECT 9101 / MAFF 303099) TaxID=266835 RepID=Q982C2_RHILO|nr:DUF1045 domain-containing protein [Mesorhizobium japonicum]BAB54537.1 mll9142 [Mesorhizobium japonicum MAFF 303099]
MSCAQPSERRYAIYYAPRPEHPLTAAAVHWLGRDAFGRVEVGGDARPEGEVLLTSEPRRYGFHATLKAPFRLREGASAEDLEEALGGFAASRPACPIGPLKIDLIDGFFALVPVSPIPALRGFAAQIVEEFDCFRAPMDGDELERRMSRQFDEVEMTNLVTWGYPYVLGRFRFHLTLTDRVPENGRAATRARLEERFGPYLSEDYHIDTLSLFVQEHRGADFAVRSQFALKTGAALTSVV